MSAPTSRPTRSGEAISFKSVPKAYENARVKKLPFFSSHALLQQLPSLQLSSSCFGAATAEKPIAAFGAVVGAAIEKAAFGFSSTSCSLAYKFVKIPAMMEMIIDVTTL